MITCPNCSTLNEEGAAFCDNCGTRLPQLGAAQQPTVIQPSPQAYSPVPQASYMPSAAPPAPAAPAYVPSPAPAAGTCPQCGAPATPGAAFCDNCGAALGAVPPTVQSPVYQQPYTSQPRLVVQATDASLVMAPGKAEYMIGREDPVSNIFPDIDLTPHGGDEGGVSRRHARLFQQGGQWFLDDYNTTNFTFVNNKKVQPGVPVPLQNGAELRLGRVKLTFFMQ